MKKLYLLIALFIFLSAPSYAANYYCDFEGANGSGTQASPFNSIANAMSSMSAADSLYCRGTTSSTQTSTKGIYLYGNNASWLAYGSGNNQATISNVTGNGIKFDGNGQDPSNGKINGFIIHTVSVTSIHLEGGGTEISDNTITDAGQIWINVSPDYRNCRDTLIHDNAFDGSGKVVPTIGYGIFIDETAGNDCDGTKIYDNTFTNSGECTLRLMCSDIHVYGNYFYKWGLEGEGTEAEPCVQLQTKTGFYCDNFYFYNNILHGAGGGYGNQGPGLQFYSDEANGFGEYYVQNNIFYEIRPWNNPANGTDGYAIENLGRYGVDKAVVKNNIFYNCGTTAADPPADARVTLKIHTDNIDKLYLYNNIIMSDTSSETIRIMNDDNSADSDDIYAVGEAETRIVALGGNAGNNAAVQPGWVDSTPEDDVNDFKLSSTTANGAAGSSYPGDNCYSGTRQEGTNEYLYPDDYAGTTRQTAIAWDMGAYVYEVSGPALQGIVIQGDN